MIEIEPINRHAFVLRGALAAGTVYGAAGLCDGIVRRILAETGEETTGIASGPRASAPTDCSASAEFLPWERMVPAGSSLL